MLSDIVALLLVSTGVFGALYYVAVTIHGWWQNMKDTARGEMTLAERAYMEKLEHRTGIYGSLEPAERVKALGHRKGCRDCHPETPLRGPRMAQNRSKPLPRWKGPEEYPDGLHGPSDVSAPARHDSLTITPRSHPLLHSLRAGPHTGGPD